MSSVQSAASAHVPEEIGSSSSIPALEERSVFIGSAQDKASEALELYLETQEQAAEAVLAGLRDAYLAEVDSLQRDGEEIIFDEYRRWLDEAFEELHEQFVQHAEKTGPLWFELAWRVGFPDPDPESRASSNDPAKKRKYQEAALLRESIRSLDASFRSLVAEMLGRLERQREDKLRSFAADMGELRVAALEGAKRDADAVTEQAFAILERSALDPEAQLPAVPSVDSAVNSEPAPRWTWPTGDPPAESQGDLRAQLEVFLKVNGFQLVDDPGKGRNVTQEFVAWRRIYLAGR